ncbi:hypothetical protein AURDEDRAFT_175852 [Auricularia subglabra TFB-10046 SS5]|nr:hypothetical protein AURDEDRAFT_175852 [Auricularia subglabra TFB-10046 SS5]
MFPRVLVLLATAALALAVCETSDNSPWTGDCYAAADALTNLGDQSCCQTHKEGYGNDSGRRLRRAAVVPPNDGIGKIGGKSNNFGDLHIEVWRA